MFKKLFISISFLLPLATQGAIKDLSTGLSEDHSVEMNLGRGDCDPALLANIFENIELVKSNLNTLRWNIHTRESRFSLTKINSFRSIKALAKELENIASDFREATRKEGEEKWFFYRTRAYLGALNEKVNKLWSQNCFTYSRLLAPYEPLRGVEIDAEVYDLLASSQRVLERKKHADSFPYQELELKRAVLEASLQGLYRELAEECCVKNPALPQVRLGVQVRELKAALDSFEPARSRLRKPKAFGV